MCRHIKTFDFHNKTYPNSTLTLGSLMATGSRVPPSESNLEEYKLKLQPWKCPCGMGKEIWSCLQDTHASDSESCTNFTGNIFIVHFLLNNVLYIILMQLMFCICVILSWLACELAGLFVLFTYTLLFFLAHRQITKAAIAAMIPTVTRVMMRKLHQGKPAG